MTDILAGLATYHIAWLLVHPERSAAWLRERLRDGFDVHHLDGNHANDDPDNLVLIEASDHMSLHGGRFLRRLNGQRGPRKPPKRVVQAIATGQRQLAAAMVPLEP